MIFTSIPFTHLMVVGFYVSISEIDVHRFSFIQIDLSSLMSKQSFCYTHLQAELICSLTVKSEVLSADLATGAFCLSGMSLVCRRYNLWQRRFPYYITALMPI